MELGAYPGKTQRGSRAGDQISGARPWVLVPGKQIGSHYDAGLGPRGHMRPARPLTLVAVGDAFQPDAAVMSLEARA